jgi:hypothetical protein
MCVCGSSSPAAAVYIYNCHQLGVVPSTQVVQQLKSAESNMSHCKLGRRGAQALRHALATNTCITSLDLTDNSLDAHGVSEIISGLTYGSMANVAPKQRTVYENKWKQLDWMKVLHNVFVLCMLRPLWPIAVFHAARHLRVCLSSCRAGF